MKQSINEHGFIDAFRECGRKDSFTYAALKAMFEYFEDMEEDCGTEIELDAIGICCEFAEYASATACIAESGYDCMCDPFECPSCGEDESPSAICSKCGEEIEAFYVEDWEAEKEETALDYLMDNTLVIQFDSGIVIQSF